MQTKTEDEYNQYKLEEKERKRLAHNKYVSTLISCECQCQVMRCNMAEHKRTKKHQQIMQALAVQKFMHSMNIANSSGYEAKLELLKKLVNIP